MSDSDRERPPRLATWLVRLLVRGEGSEHLRGDLEESHRRRVRRGTPRQEAVAAYRRDVAASIARWWLARARRGRRRTGPGFAATGRAAALAVARRPRFAALVVATLGLGLGATATIYTVVDNVVLRPLPYPGADRLVELGNTFPGREWAEDAPGLLHLAGVSLPNLHHVRERSRSLETVAGVEVVTRLLPGGDGPPELVVMARTTRGFMELLGARPVLGRGFLAEDFRPGAPPVVVLAHATWTSRYGADPGVVGEALTSGGRSSTIVGVLPPGFRLPEAFPTDPVEFWGPLDEGDPRYEDRGARRLHALASLAPGADVAGAREELRALAAQLADAFPEGNVYPDGSHLGWGANELRAATVGTAGRGLHLFLGAVLLLLAVAVLNASHLLAIRALDRRAELAVRRALGAGRGTVTIQLLTESLVLAAAGGIAGAALAWAGVEAFLRFAPPTLPRLDQVALDGRVLLAGAVLTIVVGLVTGLLPSLDRATADPARALRASGHRGVSGAGARLRTALVSAQLALAVLLGVGASLLGSSFVELRTADPGFEPDGVVAFRMPLKRPPGNPLWAEWDELLAAVAAVPGIQGAGAASDLPYHPPGWAPGVRRPGQPQGSMVGVTGYVVSPGYLEAAGTRLVRGRGLAPADGPDSEPVALVNEAFVRRLLPGQEAVGARLVVRDETEVTVEVVGVVEDVVQARLEEGPLPAIYIPYTQHDWATTWVLARSDRETGALLDDLRRAAAGFEPGVPVLDLGPIRDRIRTIEAEPRFRTLVLGGFAGVALLLAAVGLYGTLAHSVGRRRRELGVRMALGADRSSIRALVVRQAATVVGSGLTVGLLAALALAAAVEGWLYRVGTMDPVPYLAAALALASVALLATVPPVRRALRTDVTESLRAE